MTFHPIPSGMAIGLIDNRLALTLVDDWAIQYRRVYGYIGEIKLLPSLGSERFILIFLIPPLWLTMSAARKPRLCSRWCSSCRSGTAVRLSRRTIAGCTAG